MFKNILFKIQFITFILISNGLAHGSDSNPLEEYENKMQIARTQTQSPDIFLYSRPPAEPDYFFLS